MMEIGFGKTEIDFEAALEKQITNFVYENYSSFCKEMFTDKFKEMINEYTDKLTKESQEKSDIYKKAKTYPDRYTKFWTYVLADVNYMSIICSFQHVNRKHALSPDGWCILSRKYTFSLHSFDVQRGRRN